MNRDLEALLKAYDAFSQSEDPQLRAIYESRIEDLLAIRPGLSRASLDAAIRVKYKAWLKAQKKPTSIPPKA
jgi:hypothetical protein